jgi:hypothetical protein
MQSKVTINLSSPNMAAPSPPANGASTGEAEIQTIPRSAAAFEIAENGLKQPEPRPRSAHDDLRESRRWAKDNAEWIDDGNVDVQRTSNRRRASEDLLRSQPLSATFVASNTEARPGHSQISSNAKSLARDHKIGWLSRSLSTSFRGSNAHRKLHVHQQLGRFVRKITDTSNWAIKEPTASLNELEDEEDEEDEGDSFAQPAPNSKPEKASTRHAAKLSKKSGMEDIRTQRESVEKTSEKLPELNTDAIINLNEAEDNPKWSEKIPALRKQDIEDVKRSSASLRDTLSEYHSDRYGNLLPAINTDSIGDLSTGAQQKHEQHGTSISAAEPRRTPERLRGIDSSENTAWKTSNPSSDKSLPNLPLAPRPGPRTSSRYGAVTSSTALRADTAPLAGRSRVPASVQSPRSELPGSVSTAVAPPETAAPTDRMLALNLQRQPSLGSLSIFGPLPNKSTDTLTAITLEALGNNRLLTTPKLPEIESVALKPSIRPAKLHSGFVSSGKAIGDAPNRPLPDLPEVPSPESLEKLRHAGSNASFRSKRSLQRMSTEPGRSRRNSSIASLNEILQGKDPLHGSPQRISRSAKKSGSIRSSSQKGSDDMPNLTNVTGAGLASGGLSTELRSPGLVQSYDFLALVPTCYTTDSATRDQRIHNKRLQDVASARARRNKTAIQREHQSIQEGLAAEDFPRPPSSRPPSHAASQISRATIGSPGTSPMPSPALIPGPVPILSVVEPTKIRQARKSKRNHVSFHSKAAIADSQNIHGTQTPPLSESSTPSSEEDGTGVVGTISAENVKVQNGPHLSTSDLAAMVADMHAMRGQLDAQMRKIHEQSKRIRTIEMQKARMVHAVNALIAVATESATVVPVSLQGGERATIMGSRNENLQPDARLNRDSMASTSNTINSLASASRSSGCSEFTFITEPDRFSNGLTGQLGHNALEFNMDFDQMQELVRLDRSKTPLGYGREEKASRTMRTSTFGQLRIDSCRE